jgi:hypothetical protein
MIMMINQTYDGGLSYFLVSLVNIVEILVSLLIVF